MGQLKKKYFDSIFLLFNIIGLYIFLKTYLLILRKQKFTGR